MDHAFALALVSDGVQHVHSRMPSPLGLPGRDRARRARPTWPRPTATTASRSSAAFVNSITILLSAVWIVAEAFQRLMVPEPVAISHHAHHCGGGPDREPRHRCHPVARRPGNMNIRSAFLHMLTDTLVCGHHRRVDRHPLHGMAWLDPLIAVFVAIVIEMVVVTARAIVQRADGRLHWT